ncbi:MAG: hypothetical protein D4R45_06930 [Planctomycetaceae bacterium]|nr:MAG: hypothetical protein D4R45_06930 [Planctomycetaceae bacterium]
MDKSQFFWYMVCQWAMVVGTLLLAIIALWGHIIKGRWLGPKLKIALKDPKGNKSKFSDGVNSRYFHLRVFNERHAAPAHNVRVVIKNIYRPKADGIMCISPLAGRIQLAWQYQGSNPQFQTIGSESSCDLGYLRQNEEFKLSTLYQSISFNGTVKAGEKIIVEFLALSDETESNVLKIEISWDGSWSDDSEEMANHLVLRPI